MSVKTKELIDYSLISVVFIFPSSNELFLMVVGDLQNGLIDSIPGFVFILTGLLDLYYKLIHTEVRFFSSLTFFYPSLRSTHMKRK